MTNEEFKKYIDIKKLINNDNLYINNDELYTNYIDTDKLKIKDTYIAPITWATEDYNDYTTPIIWDEYYNDDIAPITWATSSDKYYHYEKPSSVSI